MLTVFTSRFEINMLLKEIDKKRSKLITTGTATGFTSEETVKCSQELDLLIYAYQQKKIQDRTKRIRKIFNMFLILLAHPIRKVR